MIERKFVKENSKEATVQEYISNRLKNVGHSHTKIQKTPLGEKIVVYASRPGLIVGRKGETIKELTATLRRDFDFENPQIEIEEVASPNLDAQIVAERIASTLERFGASKFKGVGHKVMSDVMRSGALGVEILISGKIPGSRAKVWRFYQGYLKKCGNISVEGVGTAYSQAQLKTGVVGICVKIMPGDTVLPDNIKVLEEKQEIVEQVVEPKPKKKATKKKATRKKTTKKATKKTTKKAASKSTETEPKVAEEKSESKPAEKEAAPEPKEAPAAEAKEE